MEADLQIRKGVLRRHQHVKWTPQAKSENNTLK